MATSIVTIDAPDKVVTCDAQGSTQHVFNVKNTSGQALTIGAKVLVDGSTEESWLHVDAPAEQELDDNVLTQIPVKIQVPPDGAPDRYTYRLLVYSVRRAGEEFTESEAVAFEVPEREPKRNGEPPPPPNRWWIWAAVIAGVLVIGGVLTWALWPEADSGSVAVPRLVDKPLDSALLSIKDGKWFTFNIENLQHRKAGEKNVGKVVDQTPSRGKMLPKGTEIVLTVGESQKGVVYPHVLMQRMKLKQPMVYKKLKKTRPRSIEPAPE